MELFEEVWSLVPPSAVVVSGAGVAAVVGSGVVVVGSPPVDAFVSPASGFELPGSGSFIVTASVPFGSFGSYASGRFVGSELPLSRP